MRCLTVILAFLTLPVLADETVPFDTDDRFTIEFPDTWKKPEKPKRGALVYREHSSGQASFSVTRLLLPRNARTDLSETLKSFVENFRKGGMTVVGDIKGQEGAIDGKDSIFAQVPVKLKQEDAVFDLTFFLVIIDCKDRVLVLQATLPKGGSNAIREDCRRIIGSFHEKDPNDLQKKEDKDKDGEDATEDGKDEKPAPDPKTDPRLK